MDEHIIDALADAFTTEIRMALSPVELDEVNCRNDAEGSAGLVCHTHDFFDANMAMDDAFILIHGRSVNGDDEDDCRRWNEAWARASEQRFERRC